MGVVLAAKVSGVGVVVGWVVPEEQVWPGIAVVVSWVLAAAESVAALVFDTGQELKAGFGQEVEKERVSVVVEAADARDVAGDGTAGDADEADGGGDVVLVVVRNDVGKQPGEPADCAVDSSADCSFRSGCSDKVSAAGKWQLVDLST